MTKVSDLIKELKSEYPGYRVRTAVRTRCLPYYGYSRWARYITAHDAAGIRVDIAAVMYVIKIEEALGSLGEENA